MLSSITIWIVIPCIWGTDSLRIFRRLRKIFRVNWLLNAGLINSLNWLAERRQNCEGRSDRTTSPPKNDILIEWTYTFDLDNLNFIVDSRAAFDL